MGYGEQMEHGIGRATHGNIKRHGIEEGLACGDALGKHALVALLVVLIGILHNEAGSLLEELYAVLVRSHDGAVAREGKADSLVEAVHRVGGKHARAASASGTCRTLDGLHLFVADGLVGRLDHRVDEVEVCATEFTCLHRSARHEYRGDIEAHRRHEHSGRNLVAIADTHQRVGLVGIAHILYTVGNDVARGQ